MFSDALAPPRLLVTLSAAFVAWATLGPPQRLPVFGGCENTFAASPFLRKCCRMPPTRSCTPTGDRAPFETRMPSWTGYNLRQARGGGAVGNPWHRSSAATAEHLAHRELEQLCSPVEGTSTQHPGGSQGAFVPGIYTPS
jgi:hypothetical protein